MSNSSSPDSSLTNNRERLSLNSVQSWKFGGHTRHLILILGTFCLSMVVSNALTLNFTIICMKQGDTSTPRPPMFTVWQEGWLFSAVPAGTLFGTLPISCITSRLGTRWMFTLYGLITAIATTFAPFVIVSGGFIAFLGIRFLQGVAMATSYVAMGAISAEWSPLRESGLFLCLISCHLQIGPILLMPIAGELCASQFGWPFVYYGFGVVSLFVFILFFTFYGDSARTHIHVCIRERMLIEEGKFHESEEENERPKESSSTGTNHAGHHHSPMVPYKRMCLDVFVWVILIVQIGSSLGLQIFTIYGPVYLNKALGMEVTKTGFSAALPHLLSVLVKLIAGPISDWMTWVSEKALITFFASVSQYLMAGCFVAMVFLPSDVRNLNQILFTLVIVFSGFNTVGITKCIHLISRQFSHVLFSGRTFVNSLVILLLPVLVNKLAPDGTVSQWARIFVVIAVVLVATTTLFDFYAEVEPREWARPANHQTPSNHGQKPEENGPIRRIHPKANNYCCERAKNVSPTKGKSPVAENREAILTIPIGSWVRLERNEPQKF